MASTTFEESVKRRAYELYEKRGGSPGNDQEDWFKAEQDVRNQNGKSKENKRSNGRN
jgi:hypothetical protein